MIKLCQKALLKPSSLLFNNCIDANTFPKIGKSQIFVQVKKFES